jgi:hypothetical protein
MSIAESMNDFPQKGGHRKLRIDSISTAPGQSLVLTWQSTTSEDPMPLMSQTPSEAAARVHA